MNFKKQIRMFALLLGLLPFVLQAQTISTIAGIPFAGGYFGDGGPATNAMILNPTGVCTDGAGGYFIADNYNHVVRKVNASGVISTYAGTGGTGYSGDGGAATAATFDDVFGVAYDPQTGNLYITDPTNNVVRKVDNSGIISRFAGTGVSGYNGDGIAASTAKLFLPVGIACDPSGNVYICDNFNARLRKVDGYGNISTVAGTGTGGTPSGNGGPATNAVTTPNRVAADGSGNVYIAEVGSNTVRKIDASGTIDLFAGTTGGSFTYGGDGGPATAADLALNNPGGVSVDVYGNVYIADVGNHRVRKVDGYGVITTIAGNGSMGYLGDGGPATAAEVSNPMDIATDICGSVYIAQWGGVVMRKVSNTPGIIAATSTICVATTLNINAYVAGGTWSSSDIAVATVGSLGVATGQATGISPGTAIISYTTSCGIAIYAITVDAIPTITGSPLVCAGSTTLVTGSPTTAGSWSGGTGIASVANTGTPGEGQITGISAGTDILTYTTSALTCPAYITASVDITPTVNGPVAVCIGSTIGLTASGALFGTWSSSNPAKASVDPVTGVVTGLVAGNVNISYTNICGTSFMTITVRAIPTISGVPFVCAGNNINLSGSPVAGWNWTGGTGIASVINTLTPGQGQVTGLTAGIEVLTYTTVSLACPATIAVSVDIVPTVNGMVAMCQGTTFAYSSGGALFGSWSSSATGVASVSPTGVVTAISAGTADISYINACGSSWLTVSVTATPSISGTAVLCASATTTLNGSPAGGTWTGSSSIASVVNTGTPGEGLVTGIAGGITTLTYTSTAGCIATIDVTVNATPPITGPHHVCYGSQITLYDAPGGGTWSSSITGLVNSTSGVVTGVAIGGGIAHGGVAIVNYTDACGTVSYVVVVVDLPNITGTLTVCEGSTTALSPSSDGLWSGGSAAASIGSASGVVTGIAGGTATFTYTYAETGCSNYVTVTVYPMPIVCLYSQTVGMYDEFDFSGNPGTTIYYDMQDNTMAVVGTGSVTLTGSGTHTIVETSLPASVVRLCITSVELNGCVYSCTCPGPYGCCASIHPIGHRVSSLHGNNEGAAGTLSVIPNPNTGSFTLSGTLVGVRAGDKIEMEILDILGKTIYKDAYIADNDKLDKRIIMNGNIANGVYLIKVRSNGESRVVQFTLNR